jgi:hypothetical protein
MAGHSTRARNVIKAKLAKTGKPARGEVFFYPKDDFGPSAVQPELVVVAQVRLATRPHRAHHSSTRAH